MDQSRGKWTLTEMEYVLGFWIVSAMARDGRREEAGECYFALMRARSGWPGSSRGAPSERDIEALRKLCAQPYRFGPESRVILEGMKSKIDEWGTGVQG